MTDELDAPVAVLYLRDVPLPARRRTVHGDLNLFGLDHRAAVSGAGSGVEAVVVAMADSIADYARLLVEGVPADWRSLRGDYRTAVFGKMLQAWRELAWAADTRKLDQSVCEDWAQQVAAAVGFGLAWTPGGWPDVDVDGETLD